MRDNSKQDNSDLNSFSPTLITAYSQKAISTIHSIERILYLLLAILAAFALLVFVDTAAVKGYIKFLPEDEYDVILSIIAFVAIGIIVFLLRVILDTRKKLDNWAYVFEKNSIGSLISIGLSNLDKTTLFFSIIENIGEIGEPIKNFISKNKNNIDSFFDQKISNEVMFDILIDDDKFKSKNGGDNNDFLTNKINEYGAIVGKIDIESHKIDVEEIKVFIRSLLEYSRKRKKSIGLALLAGNEITSEAMEYAKNYSHKSIGYLITIEKPSMINSVE
jgi:hypothetical protein